MRAATVALIAALVLPLAAAQPDSINPLVQGFSTGGRFEFLAPAERDGAYDDMKAVGATWVRFDLKGDVIDRCDGTYDFAQYDDDVAAARARGIRIVGVLAYTPPCQRPPDQDDKWGPDTAERRESFAARAEAIARRYAGRIAAYEIWNEPNSGCCFWRPSSSPANYAALLKATYPRLKAADPDVTVLAGATAPVATSEVNHSEPDFLEAAYAAGAHGFFDAVSTHPYSRPAMPGEAQDWSGWYKMYGTSPSLRSIMEANGDGGKSLWGTEFGVESTYAGKRYQIDYIRQGYTLWKTYPWAGVLFTYTLRDEIGFAGDRYGLLSG